MLSVLAIFARPATSPVYALSAKGMQSQLLTVNVLMATIKEPILAHHAVILSVRFAMGQELVKIVRTMLEMLLIVDA